MQNKKAMISNTKKAKIKITMLQTRVDFANLTDP
jgi:hypothetical protein